MGPLFYYTLIIINLFGISGNFLIFLTFRNIKKIKQKRSISMMAVLEFMTNLLVMSYSILMLMGKDYYLFSMYHCKIFSWLSCVLPSLSVWCLVNISIERVLHVYRIQAKKTIKYLFPFTFLIIIIVYSINFYSMGLFETRIDTKKTIVCDYYNMLDELILNSLYFLIIFAAPFIIMTISSIAIIKQIYDVRKKSVVQPSFFKKRLRKDVKFSSTILLLNLIFLAFNLPFNVAYFIFNIENIIYKVTYALVTLQFNINIFVYLAIYKEFRLKLMNLYK